MANQLYVWGKQQCLEGSIAWLTDTVKMVIVDTAEYTVNIATHQWLSDVPVAARVATSPALTGKSTTGGVAGAANPTFTAVTGPVSEAIIIYKDTGSASTSPLIAYMDTQIGIPVVPNGGDVYVVIGAGGLFKL